MVEKRSLQFDHITLPKCQNTLNQESRSYLLFGILGSYNNYTSQRGKTLKESPAIDSKVLNADPNSITKMYINYYMTSYGVLIKRLAYVFNIPPKNDKIFAKVAKEDFSVCSLTNESYTFS